MRRELLVPKLGLTMSEGVLVEWLVRPGEAFGADQSLFVIESEKAANEVGAEADGVLLEITAQAGETLPCGTVIGYWDDGRAGEAADAASVVVAAGKAVPDGQRVPVTPLARRLAAQQGVDLGGVTGSGPRGRIRARDVLLKVERNALSGRALEADNTQNPPPAVTDAAGAAAPVHGSLRAPSNLERTVAQRLTAAKQQVPHFYLAVEAEMSAVMALRGQLNAAQTRQRLTINHFVLAAVGRALEAMPEMNRVWTDEGILSLDSSDVGMAVNTDKGLLVPVLRGAGRQSLGDLARQAGELIGRAQAGRLGSADMHGGAITVSNAGMHDVTYMTSIINPGQSMILGVGSIREVFRPDGNGQPAIRREMGMVLSADHRVLDGVGGLKFLKLVVQALQQPMGLLVA
ncbi:dihydrolipoamide acetyltransferase component of pyruvate dehydrogenase complex [Alicycliphilus denitrificans]|uniref:dihydrolipoamide acetyltransferase family protein n=1 Tax=Alicycliphilus denitrificans TaxID=179636 RepID=UPI0009666630|nr:dihydrolipoamide acetyltransferase family protein [Alicycliphilus denitrificans]MBN9573893.1 2-oxo acid dehydrogenase subunit E2 [Alicycliphilus denitrificans]OJW87013.1 MAG: dihydrolipoamide acyltransferase [Alicycliphilus sp. 69-12]BCN39085.1 dihydrolipoamide acetyltransferase component of pyruvate dehydrogenase complex [Alicycliphilus denitrificans]